MVVLACEIQSLIHLRVSNVSCLMGNLIRTYSLISFPYFFPLPFVGDNVSISNSSITSNTSGKSFHSKRPRYSNRNLNQDTAHNPSIPLAQSSEGVENPNEDTSILESNNSHAFCILSVFRPSVSSTIGVSLYESGVCKLLFL